MADLQALVDAAETDELLLAVDDLAARRQWDALVDLGRRCREAVEFGRQLWAVATHIDYRLAWEGPAAYAASVLRPGAGRFALGPLTEVAASTHDWASLAPHLVDPVPAAAVAQERVIRGEDLTADPVARSLPAELPLQRQRWEPAYALPVYRDRSATFPSPPAAAGGQPPVYRLQRSRPLPDDDGVRALRAVVEAWTSQSSGRVEASRAGGGPEAAVAELADHAGIAPIDHPGALALVQWAGASGGAHGHRPGGAAGRFAAWWAAAALAGLPWPEDRDGLAELANRLGAAVADLRWYRWQPPGPPSGWVLRLAAADPDGGVSWAVNATDGLEEDALA